jgi:Holliday junction resolvase RusA-like endonuclease
MNFVFFSRLPSLNETIRLAKSHPQAYAAAKRQHTQAIASQAKSQSREPVRGPVEVHFSWFCCDRRTDPDNLTSAKKFILDGLVAGGVLEDDGWKNILSFRDSWHVDRAHPRIEVQLIGEQG